MTKPTGNPVGRPPTGDKKMNSTLGSVAVSDDMLDELSDVAKLEGVNRAAFVRTELTKSIKRIRKKHGVEGV